jgi:MATE family multidrug resistance protein
MAQAQALPLTHRSVLAVAVPIMLSNVTEPLIGVVNTAVIGRLPDAYYIGAIAVGALIFSFLFWGFGFLRLSTGGLSAQATGAGDAAELAAVFFRAVLLALGFGLAIVVLSPVIGRFAFRLIGGSAEVTAHAQTYFSWRVLSAPAALVNFVILGWLTGQGRATAAFVTQVVLNLTNMALSALFVLGLHKTSDGVGQAALIAEYGAAALGLAIVLQRLGALGQGFDAARVLNLQAYRRTLAANFDIMVRTLCLIFAFGWFTARGARLGDTVVAANAVLMNLFEVSAYLIDGFAYASEALVGQSAGAGQRQRFNDAIWLTSSWAVAVGALCSLTLVVAGPWFIDLLTLNPDVRMMARASLWLAAATPLLGSVAFQFDGIYTGALATRDMRNTMLISLALFMALWWVLEPRYGITGLWLALCAFFIARGVTMALRLPAIERRLFTP